MSTLVKPFTFSAGATIRASEHNNCFDTLFNDFNGNITNVNFSATASISDTQLATITTSSKVDFSALTTTNQATGDLMFYSGTNLWTRLARGTANQSLKCQYDSQTVLLLHCDGTDGSTVFTDSSLSAKTVTANGNAQIDVAQSVFGGASGLFDGTGDYLTIPDHADFYLDGDFAVDFRIRYNAIGGGGTIFFEHKTDDNNLYRFYYNSLNELIFNTYNASVETNAIWAWTPSVNTWYHIEVARSGNNMYCFVNGVSLGTVAFSAAIVNPTGSFYIGTQSDGILSPFNGWLDEFRISKGIARHTANFTPETQAYQPSLIWVT